jgi:hypothetical protein
VIALCRTIAFLITLAGAVLATSLFAQKSSPAAGPWSGQAQCVVAAKWADYLDEQFHTWTLTGAAPTPTPLGAAQEYYTWPAMWRVQGGGRRAFATRIAGFAGRDDQVERWTIASETNAPLTIWEVAGGTGRLRIGSRHGLLSAPLGSIRITDRTGRSRDGAVQEWQFPLIEGSAQTDGRCDLSAGVRQRDIHQGGSGERHGGCGHAPGQLACRRGGVNGDVDPARDVPQQEHSVEDRGAGCR